MAFQIGSTARCGPRVTRLSTLLRRSFQSNMKRAAIQPEIPEPPVVIAETIPRQEESEECRSSEDETRIPLPEELGSHSQLISELLLGYLPCDRSLWPSELSKKRSQYKHFKDELLDIVL
ncbi:unnamed protein product [Rhodiola kirilowii]